MDFRLLGELEITGSTGLLRLPARKQRALLALLCLHAGETLSRDLLVDQLWERPPQGAAHALEVHVSRLRKALRALDGSDGLLVSRPGGYALLVEREQVDVGRAERLVADARRALAGGDAVRGRRAAGRGARASGAVSRSAISPSSRFARRDRRLGALEDLAEAHLRLARHAEVVAEPEPLVARYPLRERPRGLLMRALYRCGRQAEALDLYQAGRGLLVDELGIEPSSELHRLQQQILRHDPSLTPAAEAPPEPTPPREPATDAPHEQRKVVTVGARDRRQYRGRARGTRAGP